MKPLHPPFCDALPVGNGSLGAVVYGGVPEECMSLNLDTLWSGTGRRMEQKIAKHVLEDVKKQCAQEHYFEAQNLIERKMLGQYNESYMPLWKFSIPLLWNRECRKLQKRIGFRRSCCANRVYVRRPAISVGGVCIKSRSCDGSASGIRNKNED